VLWISFAAAGYLLIGLWFYFSGFSFFKKLPERPSRLREDPLKDRSAASASLLGPPRSQSLVVFFKALRLFLVLLSVAFFLVMMHVSALRP
jgi:hypothetical protein